MGRNVIAVELESKFIDIIKGNWEKIKQRGAMLGCKFGQAQIIQGDARNLEGLLADKIITSPPYSDNPTGGGLNIKPPREGHKDQSDGLKSAKSFMYGTDNVGKRMMGGIKGGTGESPDNIDHLPYGNIDSIITSPPYEGTEARDRSKENSFEREKSGKYPKRGDLNISSGYQADAVITSPPYENAITGKEAGIDWSKGTRGKAEGNKPRDKSKEPAFGHLAGFGMPLGYSQSPENIGNLKSTSYLEAILLVYRQCFAVLKNGGLMILVTKNFIRQKAIIKLDEDTIKLCEQAGFKFIERHYRELPTQSFWRIIYAQRYPSAPQLKYEDILVFIR